MPEPITVRPRGGMIIAIVTIIVCAAGLLVLVFTEGAQSLAVWAWPIVLIGWLSWLLYVRPAVRVSDGFVEIDNIVRRHRVPWSAIDEVDSRYALTLFTTDGRRVRAWAAPAPGARQALRTQRAEVARTPGDGDTRRPADAEGTASGDAANIIRRRLESLRRSGLTAGGDTVTTVHVALVALTVALSAAAILTLVLPHG